MKKLYLIIILLSFQNFFAQSAGNSGLSFLKFGFGARNIAMGDAGSSASNDLSAMFYNPARLASTEDVNEAMFMHSEGMQDVTSEVGGIKWRMFNLPFAVGFNVTSVSDLEYRDNRPTVEPISHFSWNYFFGSLSSGFNIYDNLDFGVTIMYLYEGVLNDEANGFGFDFGLNYKTPVEGLTVSSVIKNLGSMNALRNEKTKLPSEFRLGGSYHYSINNTKFDLIVAGEFQKYLDTDDIHLHGGGEVVYNDLLALRAGYQSGYESRGFTGGLGILWSSLRLDYAFLPFSYGLGNANLFSVQFKF